jgi:hypothetical protein
MANHATSTRPRPNVDDALNQLRGDVSEIVDEGDDPREVLALGKLVRRSAPQHTDLAALHAALEHSTLSEVVSDTAFELGAPDDDEDVAPDPDDPLGAY